MDTAASYFRMLFDAVSNTEVTLEGGLTVSLDHGIADVVKRLEDVRARGDKVMLIGNGGSAAIASHVQNDLCKSVGVRAMVMSEPPLMMALANDDGYETVFEQQVSLWAQPGDLLIAISSGGRSENILRGVKAAHARGAAVLTFTGFAADNPLRQLGTTNFYVSAAEYGYVELSHSALLHLVTDRAASGLERRSE